MSFRLVKTFKAFPLRNDAPDYSAPLAVCFLEYWKPVQCLNEDFARDPLNAPKALRTADGDPLNRIEKGRYEVVYGNGTTQIVVIESNDAP